MNVGSINSVHAFPGNVGYTASKFGLRGLTRVTALENGKHGVRANLVCPLMGNPEMHGSLIGPRLLKRARARGHAAPVPLGSGQPEPRLRGRGRNGAVPGLGRVAGLLGCRLHRGPRPQRRPALRHPRGVLEQLNGSAGSAPVRSA